MSRLIYNCIITFLLTLPVFAQNDINGAGALNAEIEALKKDAGLKSASWSIFVIETETGNTVCAHNADVVLEPASVMKIVSTGAALSLLGASCTFETKLEYSGTVDTVGTLHGDLFITGGGDPTIGSGRFDKTVSTDTVFNEFYLALQQNNIRQIDGYLVGDASVFEENPAAGSWLWEDIGNYYASGVFGLNIYENSYRLYFNAGTTIGSRAELTRMKPVMDELTFINNVTTAGAGTGDNVVIYGQAYTPLRMLEGTVPLGKSDFDVDGAIPDPPRYFVQQFASYLNNQGVKIEKSFTTDREMKWKNQSDTAERKLLAKHISPPVSDIVIQTNMKSINLFAEAIVKACGVKMKKEGSENAGIEVVKNFWSSKNVNLTGFVMEDACGLSRKNKISTRQLAEMLRVLTKEKSYKAFRRSLPVAGQSGGMASMLKNTVAEKNLIAKTGNMDQIKSYAGYVTNASGKELAFALVFNNYSCNNAALKQKAEKLLLLISQTK
ncbi:MAG TPA: D-alanyl-D-alanine carboxypeptidase/D-alanyl-D-alanine-endopeptidase [Bacteroidales bacterium]|nr:D-alanyl-D-alanine carboxypeptidase/D-alanyl-D-alanine-endopeptidase [Bacteroidales bacterium]HOH84134.1 D-alanyl-D-alanine carboxypeptidase/D-alanyl-D-alanine-endopeptidase [Bacteroidales bacterium]HPB25261.1 D-alanyl-D-alanine carboxypeptidase/D-alanyl-D-alanine-endopeptidase [Bacteroidales bacterium]HPI30071.1 D-alanyl-D-alanine carboxypeptidase/D-alanyl-D-alanine-endopeptidase [Bacteroidales bacterium]HQN16198.1 D-alanyl-D-alanine carboxypeptidase/D-alanyl-D-alanine-endopeptidase [Bacter